MIIVSKAIIELKWGALILIVEVEVEGEGPTGSIGVTKEEIYKATSGQATSKQEVTSAPDDREVADGIDLAHLPKYINGAHVVTLGNIGREDLEECEIDVAIKDEEALAYPYLLRGVGRPYGEGVLKGGHYPEK